MTTKYGQMARARVIGPMSGFSTPTGRRPLPLETIDTPSPIYWPSQANGVARTPSRTAASTPAAPATPEPTGGTCCGQ